MFGTLSKMFANRQWNNIVSIFSENFQDAYKMLGLPGTKVETYSTPTGIFCAAFN